MLRVSKSAIIHVVMVSSTVADSLSRPAVAADKARVVFDSDVALDNVTFSVPAGSLVGLVGPNGAGKSTLLKTLVGIVPLDAGEVSVLGKSPMSARGSVGYVPQSEAVNWHFPVTVNDVVMMGRTPKRTRLGFGSGGDREKVRVALERVELWDRRDSMIRELSGGQRQRAFVARALAQEADVLLLDEAFSGVDVGSQEELVNIIRTMCLEGRTVILSTHDLTNLARTFDKVICLNCHVCAFGAPEDVFTPEVLKELYGAHGVGYTY